MSGVSSGYFKGQSVKLSRRKNSKQPDLVHENFKLTSYPLCSGKSDKAETQVVRKWSARL